MTLSDPPFVEGTVLAGTYEVREHLATTPAGHLHAVLNTSEARPRRQVLLARPADSEPDLRLPGRPPDQLPRPLPGDTSTAPAHRSPSARLSGVFRPRRR